MPPKFILEPEEIPLETVADIDDLRRWNPQRFEMEQLSAITLLDGERKIAVGYKDVRADEFWTKGHMPGYPLLPGVLMCEAAAQLCSYYTRHFGLLKGDFIGFGGMDEVRFRAAVYPGDRLIIVVHTERHNLRKMVFDCQGFVGSKMVFHGKVIGVPLSKGQDSED